MYHFCTYFDSNYLDRALALYYSLKKNCRHPFQIFVLCMDDRCFSYLSQRAIPEIRLISIDRFEKDDHQLLEAKTNRTRIEYYFTCTPSLPLFVMNNFSNVDAVTYIDADLYFFSDPAPLFDTICEFSVAIIPHRFPAHLRVLENRGIYNVGFLYFRRDRNALQCLHWWRERCNEWCYDRMENGLYADQKYLDFWSQQFDGILVVEHKGVNLAPWNLANYKISVKETKVFVDGQPLIFFHFHGLKRMNYWLYDPNTALYKVYLSKIIKEKIFAPYISLIEEIRQKEFNNNFFVKETHNIRDKSKSTQFIQRVWWKLDRLVCLLRVFATRNYIIKTDRKIF